LLITQSTPLSATLALFFYFSTHIQWAFTWPSLLPEMIGSACLAIAFLCYMMMARNIGAILVYAIAAAYYRVARDNGLSTARGWAQASTWPRVRLEKVAFREIKKIPPGLQAI
jgi:hypothetical protein